MSIWDNRKAIWCACGRCALTIYKVAWAPWRDDRPSSDHPGETQTYLAFWESGPKPRFLTRLKLAWKLLIHGESIDELALDEAERLRLIAALNEEPERFLE